MDLDNHTDRLEVERRHDGVRCRTAGRLLGSGTLAALLLVLGTSGAALLAIAGVTVAVPAAVFGISVFLGGALWAQRSFGSTVEVSARWVTVSNSGFGGQYEVKRALQDIDRVIVARHGTESGAFYLVFDDGDEQFICFYGMPERDLLYIRDLVDEARASRERRQEREGREYRFEQVAPKEISEIVER